MRALVVEDSRLARKELVSMLEKTSYFSEILTTDNGNDAVKQIKESEPEVVFLDIHLPGMNGFEVLEALDFVPPVIFTTAFDEYAIKSFEYNAIDYLMKPIGQDRLEKAVAKIPKDQPQKPDKKLAEDQQVFVRDGEKCWFVKVKDIRLFESVGNYTRIYFEKEKPLVLKSLSYLEEILDDQTYFRVNRQQIINVKFVEGIEKTFNGKLKIKLTTGEIAEASRRQSTEFQNMFGL